MAKRRKARKVRGFTSREQQAAVMAILAARDRVYARGGVIRGYHVSFDPLARKRMTELPLHMGTLKAAEDRGRRLDDEYMEQNLDKYMHHMEFEPRKMLLSHTKRLHLPRGRSTVRALRRIPEELRAAYEHPKRYKRVLDELTDIGRIDRATGQLSESETMPEYMKDRYSARVVEKLLSRGYDVLPYINQYEDPGSISYAILDPKRIKILKRRKLKAPTYDDF